jgi:hypothetical protein
VVYVTEHRNDGLANHGITVSDMEF